MFIVPVPAFATTTPLPSTSIAEALAVVPLTLLFVSVVPAFKLSWPSTFTKAPVTLVPTASVAALLPSISIFVRVSVFPAGTSIRSPVKLFLRISFFAGPLGISSG